jgi:hypothetical protein
LIWSTLLGDLGAVASVMILPYVPLPSLQPISSIALNGRSEIAVIPDGSFEPAGGGGGGATVELLTVTVALPLTSKRVAVICATPAARARTTPVEETVAIDGSLELHTTVRSTCVLFLLKRVAVACVVWANASESDASVTFTTDTIASGEFALDSIGSVVPRSEHERTPIIATAIIAALGDMRFIFWPRTGATYFRRVARASAIVQAA